MPPETFDPIGLSVEPGLKPREAVSHWIGAEVQRGDLDPRGAVRIVAEVGAVGGEREFREGSDEPFAGLPHREEAPGGLVEPAERPPHPQPGLPGEPHRAEPCEPFVRLPDGVGVARDPEQDHADFRRVETQSAKRVVEFPRHPQVPERRSGRPERCPVGGKRVLRGADGQGGGPGAPVEAEFQMAIADGVVSLLGLEGFQNHSSLRPAPRRDQRRRPLANPLVEAAPRREAVHQTPFQRAAAPDPLGEGGEHVGAVPPHPAFVEDPGQPAGSREHSEQGHLRQRDGRAAIVREEDLVAGQREFVAAPGGDTGKSGKVLLAAPPACVFDGESGLVRELAEVHLEPVGRARQHEDVGPGGEHPVEPAPDHHRPDFRVLEPQPFHGVREFDVHPQVVAVELERVPGPDAAGLVHPKRQPANVALGLETPVPVARRMGLEADGRMGGTHGRCGSCGGLPGLSRCPPGGSSGRTAGGGLRFRQ